MRVFLSVHDQICQTRISTFFNVESGANVVRHAFALTLALKQAGMSDEKLVHTKIRETFERAFWESLVEDLSCTPPSFSRVLNVLFEIKTGIQVAIYSCLMSKICCCTRSSFFSTIKLSSKTFVEGGHCFILVCIDPFMCVRACAVCDCA